MKPQRTPPSTPVKPFNPPKSGIPWRQVWDEMERNNPHTTGGRDATVWISGGMLKSCDWHEELIQPNDPRIEHGDDNPNALHPASKRDVKKYMKMKEMGTDFPPVTLCLGCYHRGKFSIWDGAHRLQAAIDLGVPIRAYVGIPPSSEGPDNLVTAGARGELPPLTLRLSILDSRKDEMFGRVEAWLDKGGTWTTGPDGKEKQEGTLIGYTDFSEYEDEVWIKYVFTVPEYRRRGVAEAMYQRIREEFPGEPITSSGTTGEGGAFRKSLKQRGIVAAFDPGPFLDLVNRYGGLPHLLEAIGMDDEMLDDEAHWDDVERRYNYSWEKSKTRWEFPMTLYRMVRLEGGIGSFRTKDAGVYWALAEKDAADYWAFGLMGPDAESWTVKGRVNEEAMDRELTLLHDILYEEERQIVLKEGAAVQVLGIKKSGDKRWLKPPWKTITAEAKEAKTMDYGKVVNILHELMPDADKSLPCPDLKIVNHTRSRWLGRCKWRYKDPNTVIELQKSVCADETSLKRVIAHGLCHHEQFLLHWSKWSDARTFNIMVKLSGGHGKDWQTIADRWNAKYGKDFITVKSDENIMLEWEEKPFFLLVSRTSWGAPKWQVSLRLTDHMREYMRFKNMEDFRLVMSDDRDFISAPVIGSPKGWGYDPKNPGLGMMAEALFKQPDLRAGWPEPPPATREEEKKRRELWIEAVNLFRQQKAQSEQHIRENREAFERDKARRLERNREALPDWYKEREPIDEPKTGALKPVRTPALKAWFGNSKVVDANGEPLVVYHGSKSPWVSSFDLGMAGKAWAGASTHPLEGIWFTSEKKAAKYFADYGPKRRANEEEFVEYGEDGEYYSAVMPKKGNPETSQPLFSVGPYDDPQKAEREARNQALLYNRRIRSDTHTMAVYLKIENPLVMDGNGGPPRTPEFYQAHQEGRDGIICTDVFDGAYKSTVYVVFSPSQIKSADRNTGTFDPNDLTITASTSKQAFIRDDLVWLKHYLTMTDAQKGEELARNWTRDLLVFLKRTDPKLFRKLGLATPSVWKEYMEDYDDKLDAATAFFQDKDMFDKVPPAIYEGFLEPQGNYIMQNDPAEAPSFLHMGYEGIVRNKWLVHMTDEPDEIARDGFRFGMHDLGRLGLTTYFTEKAKEIGGYNFGVPVDDANQVEGKYGKHAVVFRASGVNVYHSGDNEDQVIFWGRAARDIVPVYHVDNGWHLPTDKNGKPVFVAENLRDAALWVAANFDQYRWMAADTAKIIPPKPKQKRAAHQRVQMPRNVNKYLSKLDLSASADLQMAVWNLEEGVDYLNSLEFPITVYRELEIVPGSRIDFGHTGTSWSVSEEGAQSYFGPSSIWSPVRGVKGESWTLRAVIENESQIDWEGTLHANVKDPEESEIRLVQGASIKLTGVMGPKDKNYRPANRMIVASARSEAERRVRKMFKTEPDCDVAFIFADGTPLRTCADHQYMAVQGLQCEPGKQDAIEEFMKVTGAIRVEENIGEVSFHVVTPPTSAQMRRMAEMAKGNSVFWFIPGSDTTDYWNDIGQDPQTFADFQRKLDEAFNKTADSHKYTPWRENVFYDLDEGEGTQGYSNMPECVDDSTEGLSLKQLSDQAKINY